MKICLSSGKLYNIPKILTHNQIHKTSALNAKGVSNEPLRAWYRSQIDTKLQLEPNYIL